MQLMELQSPQNFIILRCLKGEVFEILLQFASSEKTYGRYSVFMVVFGFLNNEGNSTFTINNFTLTVLALNFFAVGFF